MNETRDDLNAREDLSAAHRLTVRENYHEGSWNHFSLKRPAHPEQIYITPGHIHWSQVTARNLVLMGPQREMLAGDLEPNIAAWLIHYPMQRARPDLNCFMHVHTPYATAISMRRDIAFNDRASQAAAHFFNRVAYFDSYDGSFDDEEGHLMAQALGDKSVLVLRNHGVCVGGKTVGHAWHDLYLFERACMFQMLAQNHSEAELVLIDEAVAERVAGYAGSDVWEKRFLNLRSTLARSDPDYVN